MIAELRGNWAPLSNFHIEADGLTLEHRFQAAKTGPAEAEEILAAATPGRAKRLGRKASLRDDWEEVKLPIMRGLLEAKFSDPTLAALLDSTGDEYIQEGNTWNDTYWGVSLRTGRGLNHLGHLLMEIRANNRSKTLSCESCAERGNARAAVVTIDFPGSESGAGNSFPACGECALAATRATRDGLELGKLVPEPPADR